MRRVRILIGVAMLLVLTACAFVGYLVGSLMR